MARYETFRSSPADASIARKWVFRAFLGSLFFHGALVAFFQFKKIEGFAMQSTETLAPPMFVVQQANIDPKLLEDSPEPLQPQNERPSAAPITLPEEQPEVREIVIKPQPTEMIKPLMDEDVKPSPINRDALAKAEADSAGRAERSFSDLATALLEKNAAASPNRPVIQLPPGTADGDGVSGYEGIPGRQSIEDALSNAGGAGISDKPIGMPGGALFEYNSADLRPDSIDALTKIAKLTQLYPKATFLISGHTDAIGSEPYNFDLSRRRAEAVKAWLVANVGVAPNRIETVGKGASELIVAGDRSIEEQQPNRRVEIIVRTNL